MARFNVRVDTARRMADVSFTEEDGEFLAGLSMTRDQAWGLMYHLLEAVRALDRLKAQSDADRPAE